MKKFILFLGHHIYIVLAGLCILVLGLANVTKNLSFQIVLAMTVIYLVSALVHHHHDKTLTFGIFFEYLLLALLVLVLITSFFV